MHSILIVFSVDASVFAVFVPSTSGLAGAGVCMWVFATTGSGTVACTSLVTCQLMIACPGVGRAALRVAEGRKKWEGGKGSGRTGCGEGGCCVQLDCGGSILDFALHCSR